ncbi:MAG: hypothetical protein AAFQ52_14360 [Chloroflexota bacterium]
MCHQLTQLAHNEYQQVVFTCEHGTIHLMHQHTTITMTQQTLRDLHTFMQSRCLDGKDGAIRCTASKESMLEIWIKRGAFRLMPAELIAMAELIQIALHRLDTTPLHVLLDTVPVSNFDDTHNFSQN